jgi:hypothetical protein
LSACWTRQGPSPADAAPPNEPPRAGDAPPVDSPQSEACDLCGSADTWWRNCKLLCRGCGGIVKSCADL